MRFAIVVMLACGCAQRPPAPPLPAGLELPQVTAALAPAGSAAPDVTITPTGIDIGGRHAAKITELRDFALPSGRPIVVAVDRRVTCRALGQMLLVLGDHEYRLLARRGASIVLAPVRVPSMRPIAIGPSGVSADGSARLLKLDHGRPVGGSEPLSLVVMMTDRELALSSFSGLEGTAQQPKLRASRQELGALTAAVAEIVKRRFGASPRDHADELIRIMVPANATVGDAMPVIGATLRGADGSELFGSALLSIAIVP